MKLLAIDGNSIINRAFYGVRPLSAADGTPTNAVFGFLNIFSKLLKAHNPDGVAVAFDVSRHTFRNDQYDQYKANRKGMPEDLAKQLPIVKEILTLLGYKLLTCENYEGDDILGTLAAACCEKGEECIVASGDRDCLQLVTACVKVDLQKTGNSILYTPDMVKADFGITPEQVIELKALMGDSSDNIPGVKGIGEKTALSLLAEGKTIDGIYENMDTITATPRIKKLLCDYKEDAYLSRQLATICCAAPIETNLETFRRGEPDTQGLATLLKRLELYSFFDKLGVSASDIVLEEAEAQQAETISYEIKNSIAEIKEKSKVSLLLAGEELLLCDGSAIYRIEAQYREKCILELAKKQVSVETFAAKELIKLANRSGAPLTITFDAELAAYLLNPSAKGYGILELAQRYLPVSKTFAQEEELAEIARLPQLCAELQQQIDAEGLSFVMNEIEMPLCFVLADMEEEGFCIDIDGLTRFGEQISQDIAATVEQIYKLSGEEFNINSTKELGRILFEKLALPAKKKTKTGYSTNAEVLEGLYEAHPIIPQILEYRKLSKLMSTYVTGLIKVVGKDGRVHSTFIQTETRTGRISSAEPNVQNIPVRTELGSEMRKFFVAKEGYTLVDADYSQIELRLLAHIAKDKVMIEGFKSGKDIHAMTASQVFGYPLETLPHELRSRAKAINFGIVYGIGAHSLSGQIGVSYKEAKDYIDAYLKTYSGVAQYLKEVVQKAHEEGFVKTIYGRKRDLQEIHSTNKMMIAFAERVAMNMPIQGTAADIIKLAMIKVYRKLKEQKLPAKLILQVHDELIIEAREDVAPEVSRLLKEEMEHAADLSVHLLAEVNSGKTWYEAK